MTPCGNCGAEPGEQHGRNCTVARCVGCGIQMVQCRKHRKMPMQTWTGVWPGVAECQELGWYSYFVPNGQPSWAECSKDRPGAEEDLNRLIREGMRGELLRWDTTRQRYVLR